MSNGNQPAEGDLFKRLENNFAWVQIVAHAIACSFYAFTRRNFGREFFSLNALCALGVFVGFGIASTHRIEVCFFQAMAFAWICTVAGQRLSASILRSADCVHSRYNGWPLLCDALPFSEAMTKRFIEPLLVFSIGMAARLSDFPMIGAFGCWGGIACIIDSMGTQYHMSRRAMEMNDAQIEQRVQIDTFDRRYRRR